MQILLTGGSGSVGKSVVERLVKKGYTVRVIGRRTDMEFEGAEYLSCDINNYPQLREVIHGFQAVVHLAAIPNPAGGSPEDIFRVNCQGTFNVFQAAAEEGIKRVVQASSINATGQFYGVKPAPIHYLPMDEAHETFATDAYSFSKNVIEDIGEYFWRREGISSVAYRLPYVAPAIYHETARQNGARVRALVNEALKRSPEERLAWFEGLWQSYNEFRLTRPYEKRAGAARQAINALPEDKRMGMSAMWNRVNFFTHLDERDSAQAVEKGLEASFSGSHTLFINDSHNWTGVDSSVLAELFYPEVKEFKKKLVGTDTLISIDRARELIGFEPEYSFDEGMNHEQTR